MPDGDSGRARPGDDLLADAVEPQSRKLCELCVLVLPVDGAALAGMTGSGSREMVYATDSVAQELDELQFTLGEGPCIDAFRERRPVLESAMAAEPAQDRWPGFAREAVELGARATFAFPLQAAGVAFGVLELYRGSAGSLTDAELHTALLIVTAADHLVLEELSRSTRSGTGLLGASRSGSHPEVHQATGMVAVQLGVPMQEALSRLRAAAYSGDQTIDEVSRDVVSRARRFSQDKS
jgi:GAF domain